MENLLLRARLLWRDRFYSADTGAKVLGDALGAQWPFHPGAWDMKKPDLMAWATDKGLGYVAERYLSRQLAYESRGDLFPAEPSRPAWDVQPLGWIETPEFAAGVARAAAALTTQSAVRPEPEKNEPMMTEQQQLAVIRQKHFPNMSDREFAAVVGSK